MFFVEISCITSPHPERHTVSVTRIGVAAHPVTIRGAFPGAMKPDNEQDHSAPRKIDLLADYGNYVPLKSQDGRWFLSFKDVHFAAKGPILHVKDGGSDCCP